MTNPPRWPALANARRRDGPERVPFVLAAARGVVLGSVARRHLARLRAFPDAFLETPDGALALRLPCDERDGRLAEIHAQLRDEGLIVAWRDEPYPLRDVHGGEHATIERAASRFWGTLTLGAHCNGYVADERGRPTHLWIARRSDSKPTDPGRLDNLIGGGVPRGQSAREALLREGWEEAGLERAQLAGLAEGEVIELDCDIPEGRQHEHLYVFDLALPEGLAPRNTDGEVAWHRLMPVGEALERAAAGELTTDAALATLAFALRMRGPMNRRRPARDGRTRACRTPKGGACSPPWSPVRATRREGNSTTPYHSKGLKRGVNAAQPGPASSPGHCVP